MRDKLRSAKITYIIAHLDVRWVDIANANLKSYAWEVLVSIEGFDHI